MGDRAVAKDLHSWLMFSVYASTVPFRLSGQENNLFWCLHSLSVINQPAATFAQRGFPCYIQLLELLQTVENGIHMIALFL